MTVRVMSETYVLDFMPDLSDKFTLLFNHTITANIVDDGPDLY